ncbi:adhesion G-protein coupled receptor G5-like [Scomber scombrus]|uniref:adhesion G-protein coupled receptor G5-like n=1 Tax=Scomber scombrus TaxID=13677 RepID=UPI002DD7F690|nr:adhesion G-protein coupled receptor G5-like [Scomber scombrus]
MELPLINTLRAAFILIILISTVSSQVDWDFCGTWRHGRGSLKLNINLTTGCNHMLISANENSLSISGQITAQCMWSEVLPLDQYGLHSGEESDFCLYWEPLLDQMKLQIGGMNLTLCWPTGLPDSCCTGLTDGPKSPTALYGIANTKIKEDPTASETLTFYNFTGDPTSCKTLCPSPSSEMEMKEDFKGQIITSPIMKGVPPESATTVYLPPSLKQAAKNHSKVVCTFFKNNSLFQDGHEKGRILNDVVGITVENEVIKDLPEKIRITFHHDVIPKTHSRKCVSWDTRKDPIKVHWLGDGCETLQKGANHTECLCDHMTYFAVLVQLEDRPVRHLLALTTITSLGCTVSVISCVTVLIFLCRKRKSMEESLPIHLGLAASLAFLNLLFFFTGILANVGGEGVCVWVGAALHYALLSSFFWMGIEVVDIYWLICKGFNHDPKIYVCILVGFVLPAVPVIVLAAVGDIYGLREVVPSDDVSNPYRMCWMKNNSKAWLAHYFTTMTILPILVITGMVMLFLFYWKSTTRNENTMTKWRRNRVAFFSIWGLSCVFGTTWGLTFLDIRPLSEYILFISCIFNSFQGFFLMLWSTCWMEDHSNKYATCIKRVKRSNEDKMHSVQELSDTYFHSQPVPQRSR